MITTDSSPIRHFRTFCLWVACLALTFGVAGKAGAIEKTLLTPELVQKNVSDVTQALYNGDVDMALKFTHPQVMQSMGGPQSARKQLDRVTGQMKSLGMKLESLKFPAPPQFVSGGGNQFVIVPMLAVVTFKSGEKIESLSFQVGVLDAPSASWKYIDGSGINDDVRKLLLPGLPADVKFPQTYRKKI